MNWVRHEGKGERSRFTWSSCNENLLQKQIDRAITFPNCCLHCEPHKNSSLPRARGKKAAQIKQRKFFLRAKENIVECITIFYRILWAIVTRFEKFTARFSASAKLISMALLLTWFVWRSFDAVKQNWLCNNQMICDANFVAKFGYTFKRNQRLLLIDTHQGTNSNWSI